MTPFTSRFLSLVLALLAAILLAACTSHEPDRPTRPGESQDPDAPADRPFVVSSAALLSISQAREADTFAILLTEADGGSLAVKLPAAKMSIPSGRFNAAGAVLRRDRAGESVATGGHVSLSWTAEDVCSFAGTIEVNALKISLEGTATLALSPQPMAVQLNSYICSEPTPDGLAVTFGNTDDWLLSVVFPDAKDVWDIASGTYTMTSGATLRDMREGIDYPLSGAMEIASGLEMLAGRYADGLLSVSFGVYIGTRPSGPDPEPTPDPEPDDYEVLESLLRTEVADDGTVRLYLGDQSAGLYYDPKQWQIYYTGTGRVLVLEINTADGQLRPGVYPASDTAAPGTFRIGYDPGDIYGIGVYFRDWGTCLLSVEDGTPTATHITDGAVHITPTALTIVSTSLTARYTSDLTSIGK